MNKKSTITPLEIIQMLALKNSCISTFIFCEYRHISEGHNSEDKYYYISRKDIIDNKNLTFITKHLKYKDTQFGIFSVCITNDNKVLHLPLMDLQLEKRANSLKIVKKRLKEFNIKNGWIVETGQSYHLYGSKLFSQIEWVNFMGKMLLTNFDLSTNEYKPFSDAKYIAHSIIRGGCVLRITTRYDKTFAPKVIGRF